MSKPTLGYWGVRGYGQPIRFLLAYVGVDYEDKLYSDFATRSDWMADKFSLGLDFPNIPYWIEGDIRLTETRAIIRHLAQEKGVAKNLIPSDAVSKRQMDMLENVIFDIWPLLSRFAYINSDVEKEALKTQAPAKFEQMSKFLGSKKFLLGDKVTYVDFLLYELLFFYTAYDAAYLKPYQNLADYKKRFEAIPEIAAYMKSPRYIAKGCTAPAPIAKVPIGY